MTHTTDKMRAALASTDHPHPFFADAAGQTRSMFDQASDSKDREGIRSLVRVAADPHIHEYVYKASSDTEHLARLADVKTAAENGIGDVVSEVLDSLGVTRQHADEATPDRFKQLAAGTYDDITTCVYDGRPATAHRTGESGNRYGLCADCAAYTVGADGLSVIQHPAAFPNDGGREHREDAPAKPAILEQADTDIATADERAIRLRIERHRLADLLNPTADGAPLDATEPYATQYAAAAFSLAVDAMNSALDASPDPARTMRALRTALTMAFAEAGA